MMQVLSACIDDSQFLLIEMHYQKCNTTTSFNKSNNKENPSNRRLNRCTKMGYQRNLDECGKLRCLEDESIVLNLAWTLHGFGSTLIDSLSERAADRALTLTLIVTAGLKQK
jgi:hypothetical protein